jgi:predicted amidohydrolase YtcJ
VQLEGCASIDDLAARIAGAAAQAPPPAWVTGAGWDADALGRWPTADDLDGAAPGRMVAVWAHDHHALLASHAALAAAGVSAGSGDPEGGVIRRDDAGRPTGVLHETAARLVAGIVPAATTDDVARALPPLVDELVALGVVAAHDPGGLSARAGFEGPIEAYRRLAGDGRLGMRVHACVRPEQLETAGEAGYRSGAPLGPDPLDRLRLGWLKTFADGSLGSGPRRCSHRSSVTPASRRPPTRDTACG